MHKKSQLFALLIHIRAKEFFSVYKVIFPPDILYCLGHISCLSIFVRSCQVWVPGSRPEPTFLALTYYPKVHLRMTYRISRRENDTDELPCRPIISHLIDGIIIQITVFSIKSISWKVRSNYTTKNH